MESNNMGRNKKRIIALLAVLIAFFAIVIVLVVNNKKQTDVDNSIANTQNDSSENIEEVSEDKPDSSVAENNIEEEDEIIKEEENEEVNEEQEAEENNDEENVSEEDTPSEEVNEASEQPTELCFFYVDGYLDNPYEGYLDEYGKLYICKKYTNCDFDEDGLTDRVYVTPTKDTDESDGYKVRIDFGNGSQLDIDTFFDICTNPYIYSADLRGTGQRSIIVQSIIETSTEPYYYSDFNIYSYTDSGYQKEKVSWITDVRYSAEGDKLRVSINNPQYDLVLTKESLYSKDEKEWKDVYLSYYDGEIENLQPFLVGVKKKDSSECLILRRRMLDKWCPVTIEYEMTFNGDSVVFDNIKETDRPYTVSSDILTYATDLEKDDM